MNTNTSSRRRFAHLSIATAVCIGIVVGGTALRAQDPPTCPPCNADPNYVPPPRNHGANPSTGQAYVWYYFDTNTFGSNASLIYDGVQKAVTAWNSQSTCYYFTPMPSDAPQPDVYIQNTVSNGIPCARNTAVLDQYPHVISLNAANLVDRSSDQIAWIVEHELGHSIGLLNAPGCGSGVTIMSGYADTCVQVTQSIQAVDVSQSNAFCNKNGQCTTSTDAKDDSYYPACPQGPSCGEYLNPDYCTWGTDNSGCPPGSGDVTPFSVH